MLIIIHIQFKNCYCMKIVSCIYKAQSNTQKGVERVEIMNDKMRQRKARKRSGTTKNEMV